MRSYGVTNAAPYASAPAVGAAGDTYFNTTSKQLYLSDGTQWLLDAVQSAYYFHGVWAAPSGTLGNDVGVTVQWSTLRLNGVTNGGANGRLTVTNAGKYEVTAALVFQNSSGTATTYSRCFIYQYNSVGTQMGFIQIVGNAIPAGGYGQAIGIGVFDCSAGDFFIIQGAAPNNVCNFHTNCYIDIIAIGGIQGPAGPQGPDITAAQSSYLYAIGTGPSGNLAQAYQDITWGTVNLNNGINTAGTTHATVTNAGRYRVSMDVSYMSAATAVIWMLMRIQQYSSGGTLKTTKEVVGSSGYVAQAYGFGHIEGLFDVAAGDYFTLGVNPGGANYTIDLNRGVVLTIIPVGGVKGDIGPQGPSGGPVPVGGTTGQQLVKTSNADGAVGWVNEPVPVGGAARQVLVKSSATDYATQWRKPVLVDAGTLRVNQSFNAGTTDTNICTVTSAGNGWLEVDIIGIIEFGFGGQVSSSSYMFYDNSWGSQLGGAYQTPVINIGVAAAGTWVRNTPGLSKFGHQVAGGNSYTPVFRFTFAVSSGSNCWIDVTFGWKLYEN